MIAVIHSLGMFAIGGGFALMGLGLFALTLRKMKPIGPNPTKAQLREREALENENNKLRIGAAVAVGMGVLMMVIF